MKKLLITIITISCMMSAKADIMSQNSETLVFGYCAGMSTSLGVDDTVLEAAIEIPQELAEAWKGNTITAVRVGFGYSTNHNISLYITETLTGYPYFFQQAEITKERDWNEFQLDTPYTFDGTPVYIGYQSYCSPMGTDFPIGVDLDTEGASPYGDWIALDNVWLNVGDTWGNVSLQIVVEGENNLPQTNASVRAIDVPLLVEQEIPFSGTFMLTNEGVNPIESIEYEVAINETYTKRKTVELSEPLTSGNLEWIELNDLICDQEGSNIPVKVSLISVNGNSDFTSEKEVYKVYINCSALSFQQMVLVEEFTGTWCGNCPWGIEAMKYMNDNYSDDSFIGVAVHYNDQMQSPSYVAVNDEYSRGSWPSAMINREFYCYPTKENILEYYNNLANRYTFAGIEISEAYYSEEENAVIVTGKSRFANDISGASYKMTFGLAENNVGPYYQSNYFSGVSEAPEGWSSLPKQVMMEFNEVGRYISAPFGETGSIPSDIIKGEEYDFTVRIPYNKEWNLMNSYIVGMIIDGQTGKVVNSAKLEEIANASAGIKGLSEDKVTVYKVYNPQGIKIIETDKKESLEFLPKGIYIINGKKILIP